MGVFFTSDTHFGDPRGIGIDRRPFASVGAHDGGLILRWNETVGPEDDIWHLGDFASGRGAARAADTLAALNGIKHLITGNNDGPSTLAAPGWASVQAYAELRLEGRLLILCHYPFRTWNGMGRGAIDLHGHSHGRLKALPRQFDVGVDAWDYRPVSLRTILTAPNRRPGAPVS